MPPKICSKEGKKVTPRKRGPKPGSKRIIGNKKLFEDMDLLQRVSTHNPFLLPKEQRREAWEAIAADINAEENTSKPRSHQYCSDRVRNLLDQFDSGEKRVLPTGSAAPPEPSPRKALLQEISETRAEAKEISEAEKRKTYINYIKCQSRSEDFHFKELNCTK